MRIRLDCSNAIVKTGTCYKILLNSASHFCPTLAQIVDLAARATSEQVRLQAAKDIMDRAGLKPTERIENITVEKSTEELRKELAQLMGSVTEPDEEEESVTLN